MLSSNEMLLTERRLLQSEMDEKARSTACFER